MKVGDLVTLSEYGRKLKRTGWVIRGDIGIIKKIRTPHLLTGFTVHWIKSNWPPSNGGWAYSHEREFSRKDLRFVRGAKR
tara:strand:+ start:1106 stop:1345 length:240 start_codon:yes stop_codon:yes gene_type:complete